MHPLTIHDVIDTERAQVQAGAPGCGHVCDCHSGLPCARTAGHETTAAGWRDVHVGVDPDGGYVQYQVDICT
jgi:hypothetical protein